MNHQKILLPLDSKNALIPWLWIGTWSMAGHGFGPHDEQESLRVLYDAAQYGITHFDTAGFYARGIAEQLIRKVIKNQRETFFISTKGGLVWNGKRVEHNASPFALKKQLYESLKRLNTDYMDLYQLHWPDPKVRIQDSILTLKELQTQGLIRYWGVGNFTSEEVEQYMSEEKNIPHQVHLNPIHSNNNILIAAKTCCINCIISPLEQGLLGTGSSSKGKIGISKRDVRNRNPYFSSQKVMLWNDSLQSYIARSRLSKVSVVLMWICSQPHVHAIVPGPRTRKQVEEIYEFIRTVNCNGFASDDTEDTVLSQIKVRAYISSEVWAHLCLFQ